MLKVPVFFKEVPVLVKVPVFVKLFVLTFLTVALMVFEQTSFLGDLSSSSSSSPLSHNHSQEATTPQRTGTPHNHFTGELDVHPVGLLGRCVTVRFRGTNESLTVDEAVDYLQTRYSVSESQGYIDDRQLYFGLAFVDEPDGFLSLAKGVFHLFHFLEFLVVGYSELHRLASAANGTRTRPPTSNGTSSLSTGFPSISVPWIYVPLMTQTEICGVNGGINCIITDLVFSSASAFEPGIHGLESNDDRTVQSHPDFSGQHVRGRKTKLPIFSQVQANNRYQDMVQEADAAILINRADCMDDIHKMWNGRTDNFPVQQWHSDVWNSLGYIESPPTPWNTSISTSTSSGNKLVVGYIDRQNTKRSLPPADHKWLTDYLADHPLIDFYHLHMEDYSPLDQIQVTASCDVLIGGHGNGLSHVLWMKPERYVVEIFWRFRFQFDYCFASAMMHHSYLGLFDGEPIDPQRVQSTDPTLKTMHRQRFTYDQNTTAIHDRITAGRRAIHQFLQGAMQDLNIGL
jgi:hypothetical protein